MILLLHFYAILIISFTSIYPKDYWEADGRKLNSFYSQDTMRHAAFLERIEERERMVRKDIKGYPHHPIQNEAVLAAMRKVPRHKFVPESLGDLAYKNTPLPIGFNQTISQPFIVASMTESLNLSGNEKVLEIGTGSGYQAAVLAEICQMVYSIEIIPELGKQAKRVLNELGYSNIHVKIGNGYEGWPEAAPFDRIIVTCAPAAVPEALVEQLKPEGIIAIPVGVNSESQYLVLVNKTKNGKIQIKKQYPVRFVPMTGKPRK